MDHPTQTPTVHGHSSAVRFLERMKPLLLAHEARYGLMLGIALTVVRKPEFYSKNPPYFAIADDSEGIAAAAIMTPPHGLIVFSERDDSRPALRAIAQELFSQGWSLPSVNGPEPVCTHFATIWSELTGASSHIAVKERTFEVRQVIHPPVSPGHMRQATLDDLELVAQWLVDFTDEALHLVETIPLSQALERSKIRIEDGMLYLWVDCTKERPKGEPVSFVGTARPTVKGIAIGPVYTPPQFRGRGYASSCVAQVSQLQLDRGREFCTLFTDLGNPTSNHIYQAIGYRPICDYTVYSFKN